MFIGDGYDPDLFTGFEKAIGIGADVFVLEGGPYNGAKNPVEAFAKAVAASRILCPGKVVGTNGAYERECRIGLVFWSECYYNWFSKKPSRIYVRV